MVSDCSLHGQDSADVVAKAPIQTKLIVKEMLTKTEVDWVNSYHAEVFEKVSPHLQKDTRALGWLKEACTAI